MYKNTEQSGAVPLAVKRAHEEASQRQFEAMAHAFFQKWQPRDPDEANRFSGDLFALVAQIHKDACKPLMDQIVSMSKLTLFSGVLTKKD